MTLVLDAGALIADERGTRGIATLVRRERVLGRPAVTSAAVVAQVWRGGSRQAELTRLLIGAFVHPLTAEVGPELGVLLGRSGTSDVVDAHVAWLARPGDVVLTSDPDNLNRLLDARGVGVAVRRV